MPLLTWIPVVFQVVLDSGSRSVPGPRAGLGTGDRREGGEALSQGRLPIQRREGFRDAGLQVPDRYGGGGGGGGYGESRLYAGVSQR
ncbi:hypothetical protein J3E71DRAFT_343083 [Bipolaris maydis]|nr:hypothetical protein J3E71DRAFT_343083 [Bipolaris maydis]